MQLIGKNLHSDLPFFLSKNSFTQDINLKKDRSAIQQSVINIVLTRLGERPFVNTLGTKVYDLMFENMNPSNPNNDINILGYKYTIKNALDIHEPRIYCDDVIFSVDPSNVYLLNIDVVYGDTYSSSLQTVRVSIERTR